MSRLSLKQKSVFLACHHVDDGGHYTDLESRMLQQNSFAGKAKLSCCFFFSFDNQ